MTAERHDTFTTDSQRLPNLEAALRSSAHLLVTQGEGVGRQVTMSQTPLIVGRSSDCDMRLLNRAVSRLHCRLWRDGTGFWLRDLNSTNKTYLNDRPVIEARLKDGDFITVGGTVMQFIEKAEAANEAEVLAPNSNQASVEVGGNDLLTGLMSSRLFFEDVEREIARCRRHGRSFVLAMMDIDNLGQINKEHGMAAGDDVIRQVARMIRAGLRQEDLAARVGQDEVAVLLTELGLENGLSVLQSVRSAVANAEFSFSGRSLRVSVSIGAAAWDGSYPDHASLQARAAQELQRAKTAGKNQISS
jgi:diguanylate cyclase (GGDEF)-like protein